MAIIKANNNGAVNKSAVLATRTSNARLKNLVLYIPGSFGALPISLFLRLVFSSLRKTTLPINFLILTGF